MLARKHLKTDAKLWFGGDPEIFLTLDGKIVGSEKAIPEDGIHSEQSVSPYTLPGSVSLIRDGVQVEINIPPTHCRQWLVFEIATAFQKLNEHLRAMGDKKFEVSFRQLVDVDAAELASLSKMSRRLGCEPSFNWYQPLATIGVNPDTYTKRSAGGHLHFGLPEHLMSERERLPPICDIIIGNTSVLLDRCPDAAERRKVYGRAGEFRSPRHGFEYRTLSNFWLRSKELVSLMTGLMRLTVFILDTSVSKWPADEALFELVQLKDVERAINENNLELAKANFEAVKVFLKRHLPESPKAEFEVGLDGSKLTNFDKFVRGIDEGGLERWFPKEPLHHWLSEGFNLWLHGWEEFLCNVT